MLAYLKTSFLSTLINISVTYVFFFIAGTLGYFYLTYGFVRKLDLQDIVVFTGFILIGIIINFVANKGLIKQQIQHIESSLGDLNDEALPLAMEQIKSKKRLDRKNNFLLSLALLTGFLTLVTLFSDLQF